MRCHFDENVWQVVQLLMPDAPLLGLNAEVLELCLECTGFVLNLFDCQFGCFLDLRQFLFFA